MEALLYGSFRLCFRYKNVHWETGAVKSMFKYGDYFQKFLNHIKQFLNELLKGTLIYGS